MKQKREYIDYLRDILDATQKAEQFVAGIDIATATVCHCPHPHSAGAGWKE
jgi:hypothetical protein